MQYDVNGVPKVSVGEISVSQLDNLLVGGGKFNILNDTDNLYYTIGLQNINGQPVFYTIKGGNLRMIGGKPYILNDTDLLWYRVGIQNINGQPVLFPAIPGITLP